MFVRISSTSQFTSTQRIRRRAWDIERFLKLLATVFQDRLHFHRYAALTAEEAEATARRIWQTDQSGESTGKTCCRRVSAPSGTEKGVITSEASEMRMV